MKHKSKLLLSAAAMLVLSTGAMVTGTVAWFTATRQINVSFNNVTVTATEGDLMVALVPDAQGFTTSASQGALNISGTGYSTDISGDGINMYKPKWNYNFSTAIGMTDVTNHANFASYYTEFQLTISRTVANATISNGFLVYLGSGSTVLPVTALDAQDEAAVKAARVAIIDGAKTTRKVIWAPEAGDATYNYVAAGAGTFFGLTGYAATPLPTASAVGAVTQFVAGNFVNHTAIASATSHSGGNSPVIADLTYVSTTPTTTATVTVRVWIEGEDVEATNDAREGLIKINLDLYAMGF